MNEDTNFVRPEAAAIMREFGDEESAKTIIDLYNRFAVALSRAAYEGSEIVRTEANAEFVMAREVPWEELPLDVKRAWIRSGLAAGHVYAKHHDELTAALRLLTRKSAAGRGEIYLTDPDLEAK